MGRVAWRVTAQLRGVIEMEGDCDAVWILEVSSKVRCLARWFVVCVRGRGGWWCGELHLSYDEAVRRR